MTKDQSTERLSAAARPENGSTLAASVIGHALYRLSPHDVPAVRRQPGPVHEGARPSPSVLRYSDEQTVAGVAAVFSAIERTGKDPGDFDDWGVVVASRFLGRANLAQALRCFASEGVWGTSPHLIPHFALHSPSGAISLALKLHGPNVGVGGGEFAEAEGFLAAVSWLAAGIVPGVWLVLSGWDPELVPGSPPTQNTHAEALALALVASDALRGQKSLRLVFGAGAQRMPARIDLKRLAKALDPTDDVKPRTIATDPRGALRVELLSAAEGWG